MGGLIEWEVIYQTSKDTIKGSVYADSYEEAKKIFEETHPNLTILSIKII